MKCVSHITYEFFYQWMSSYFHINCVERKRWWKKMGQLPLTRLTRFVWPQKRKNCRENTYTIDIDIEPMWTIHTHFLKAIASQFGLKIVFTREMKEKPSKIMSFGALSGFIDQILVRKMIDFLMYICASAGIAANKTLFIFCDRTNSDEK